MYSVDSTGTQGWFMSGRERVGGMRLQHAFQNGLQFKTCESFISGIFHLVFLDHSWPLVTETAAGLCICVCGATVIKKCLRNNLEYKGDNTSSSKNICVLFFPYFWSY